jgi:hypothetical protein
MLDKEKPGTPYGMPGFIAGVCRLVAAWKQL